MKALTCDVILTGVSTRADGSLGLRFTTPELQPDEKLAFLEATDQQLKMLLQPEGLADGIKEVKGEFDRKTSSQRLRSVLFVSGSRRKSRWISMSITRDRWKGSSTLSRRLSLLRAGIRINNFDRVAE